MDGVVMNVAEGTEILENIVSDPLAAVLVVIGTLIIVGSMAVFGYLSLGALVEFVIPDSVQEQHP